MRKDPTVANFPTTNIIPVILSGGTGSRLWPLSRELYPKQLLPLVGIHTMLQDTALRCTSIRNVTKPIIVCNEEHRFMVAEQLRAINNKPDSILLEPFGRNTAPAVALAAFQALGNSDKNGNPLLLVLPADHVIQDTDLFCSAVEQACIAAGQNRLVTFGIPPNAPETGYGYIKQGAPLAQFGKDVCEVSQFVEKPDRKTAEQYLESGNYFWNSGIFLLSAQHYLNELQRLAPEIHTACLAAYTNAMHDEDFIRIAKKEFAACPSDSIDYAVMEKSADIVVVPLAASWNDVGAWSALWEIGNADASGNVQQGDVLSHGTTNCYIRAGKRLVTAVGVDNLIIVETPDAILVANKDKAQDVKQIVDRLNEQKRPETIAHTRVARPWGAYQSIDAAERFQVKRITVKPGASLSLQMHHHRAEHWIVVSGTARVVKGDTEVILTENQSTYIPLGVTHRLENPGVIPLELIEVQSGSYLGEDDIVRFEDVYGRS